MISYTNYFLKDILFDKVLISGYITVFSFDMSDDNIIACDQQNQWDPKIHHRIGHPIIERDLSRDHIIMISIQEAVVARRQPRCTWGIKGKWVQPKSTWVTPEEINVISLNNALSKHTKFR